MHIDEAAKFRNGYTEGTCYRFSEGKKSMIAVCNRILVHPDYHEKFEERFRERERFVDKMAGFVSFQILKPLTLGDPYVVMTIWESLEYFEAWKQSDAFRAQHNQQRRLPDDALLAPPQIEIAEIIQQRLA